MESNDISVRPYKHQVLFVITPYKLMERLYLLSTCYKTTPLRILWCAFDTTQCGKQDPQKTQGVTQSVFASMNISVKFVLFKFPLQTLNLCGHILAQKPLQEPMTSHLFHTHHRSQLIQMAFLPGKLHSLEMSQYLAMSCTYILTGRIIPSTS